MPLVPARLPVLQSLDVEQYVLAFKQVKAVLLEQRGQLCESGVFELVQPGGQDVVGQVRRALRRDIQEPLQHQNTVVDLTFLFGFPLVGKQVVAQVHPVGEGVLQDPHRPGVGDPDGDLDEGGVLHQVG